MSSAYSAVPAGALFFRGPAIGDLDEIYAIEAASYPEDEAATREKLEYRIRNAPEVFLVCISSGGDASGSSGGGGDAAGGANGAGRAAAQDEIVGYACGTCSGAAALTHESMSTHQPGGRLLCIHSVAIAAPHRRRGVASRLLAAYVQYAAAGAPGLEEARLLCKEDLVPLYARAGFSLLGPSPVVHGRDQWMEMARPLGAAAAAGAAAGGAAP
ncbi:MAG: acyl-CoA N-acyltransferase [Monoraphidium minutum]|nr:MAG: acyl-CoA N-acyltransferase [Monoraphidium minutum]